MAVMMSLQKWLNSYNKLLRYEALEAGLLGPVFFLFMPLKKMVYVPIEFLGKRKCNPGRRTWP